MFALRGTEIEKIDRASIRILAEIGVRVDDAGLRAAALKAGAIAGKDADRVLLPEAMVRKYVGLAPSVARYADCKGNVTEVGPGKESTFWTGAALNYIEGDQSRAISSADLGSFTRVADALSTVFAVVGTSLSDVPPQARDVVGLRVMAQNTRKHLRPLLFSAANVPAMVEIAQIIAGGRGIDGGSPVSFGYSCLSPLHWSQITIDMWRNSAGHKIPVMLNGEPISGATSPVTLAGSLALSNAEILAGVVLCQLIEEGRPVIHNLGFAHVLDMRSAACLSGSAECAMMAWTGARLAEFYNLPSASWMCTDSMIDDEQSTMEKMLTGLSHVHGGVGVIWGMGQLETQKALSAVQLVMDHEVALAAKRMQTGFAVNDDTLALGAIRDVVEGGQEFISHEHTLMNFRTELSSSPLLSRILRQDWAKAGSTTLSARARAKVADILAAPATPCLTDQQEKDIRKIEERVVKAAR